MLDDGRPVPQGWAAHTRFQIEQQMVGALQTSTTFSSEAGLQLAFQLIQKLLGRAPVQRRQLTIRGQLIELVTTLAQPDSGSSSGLTALVQVAESLEPGTHETVMLHRLLDEWMAVPLFAEADWMAFRRALTSVVLPTLDDIFRAATNDRMPHPPRYCRSAWHMLANLADLCAGIDGLPPYMAFLDLISEHLAPEVGEEIRTRNQRRANELGLTGALHAVQVRHNRTPPTERLPSYLMIQLEPDALDPDEFTMSHWFQWNVRAWHPRRGEDRQVRRANLEIEVERLIEEMESDWAASLDTVTIEFILSWDLLNSPVDWWLKESSTDRPVPLSMDYPVVVRSLERLRTRRWHRLWRARWQQLQNGSQTPHWSTPEGDDYYTMLETDLKSDDEVVLLVLSEPPEGSGGGRKEIEAALRAGLPVIVWHRTDCTGQQFRDEVTGLCEQRRLVNLPIHARELRRRALRSGPANPDHIGRHLTVLWDDPERQPEIVHPSEGT